jgi:hypothetical protein
MLYNMAFEDSDEKSLGHASAPRAEVDEVIRNAAVNKNMMWRLVFKSYAEARE